MSTPGDLLFHVRHERMDLCFEFVTQVMSRLATAVTVVDEAARVLVDVGEAMVTGSAAGGPFVT